MCYLLFIFKTLIFVNNLRSLILSNPKIWKKNGNNRSFCLILLLYWGDSKLGGRPKLHIGDIGNLTPPGERAPLKIILKKKFRILEIFRKWRFSTCKVKFCGACSLYKNVDNLIFFLPVV